MRFWSYFDVPPVFEKLTMFEKKIGREKIEKTFQTMSQKDRGDLKLHFSVINNSANSKIQQENRLWKLRFSAYSREGEGGGGGGLS